LHFNNGGGIETNIVYIDTKDPEGPSINKTVNDVYEYDLNTTNEIFEYKVKVQLNSDTRGYESLEINDTLEGILEIMEEPTVYITGSNKNIQSFGNLMWTSRYVEFELKEGERGLQFSEFAGDEIVLSIKARIRPGTTREELNQYSGRRIPNTAILKFNNNPGIESNMVYVRPPEPGTTPDIKKEINNGLTELAIAKGSDYVYRITVTVPSDTSQIQSMAITDTVHRFLEITEDPSITFNGNVVMGYGSLTWNRSTGEVHFDFYDNFDYSRIAGATIVITIPSRIRTTVSDAEIIAEFGNSMRIPNRAELLFNGGRIVTDPVHVYPPTTTTTTPPPPTETTPGTPPPSTPVPPTYTFVDNGDGTYTVMDGDTPLGTINKNPEEETIYMDDITPLGAPKVNPVTGFFEDVKAHMPLVGPAILLLAVLAAYVVIRKRRLPEIK